MQDNFINNYKRQYFIKELLATGVTQVARKDLEQDTARELRFALAIVRVKEER